MIGLRLSDSNGYETTIDYCSTKSNSKLRLEKKDDSNEMLYLSQVFLLLNLLGELLPVNKNVISDDCESDGGAN